MQRIFSATLLVVALVIFLLPSLPQETHAQEILSGFNSAKTGAGITTVGDPRGVTARIISVFLSLLGVIFVAILFYAGFLWMTGGGEEEKVKKAKAWISSAIIGLLIILTAYAVSRFVFNSLSNVGVTNM